MASMKLWPQFKANGYLKHIFDGQELINYENLFQQTYEGKIDEWDYQYTFCNFVQHGLIVKPKINMIRNIGFGAGGTHTEMPTIDHLYMDEETKFPLIHPNIMAPVDRRGGGEAELTEYNNINSISWQLKERDRLETAIKETEAKFNQLLQTKQYYAIIILFKSTLREKTTWPLSLYYPLYPHHLQWAYYTALAYFNLGDYEHVTAMLNVILMFDPKNVRILIMLMQTLIKQGLWDEASKTIGKFNNLQVNMSEKAEIDNIFNLISSHIKKD
ncbi:MAG: hypothetical protein IJ797_12055 [Selenomonadaceae bacterium]|nr:hypothetical protein [Selenomonadaceae bacterium]